MFKILPFYTKPRDTWEKFFFDVVNWNIKKNTNWKMFRKNFQKTKIKWKFFESTQKIHESFIIREGEEIESDWKATLWDDKTIKISRVSSIMSNLCVFRFSIKKFSNTKFPLVEFVQFAKWLFVYLLPLFQ